jgi:nitrite reductase (NADH) large subunit
MLKTTLEQRGMRIELNAQTQEIVGTDRVTAIRLNDGTEIAADLVVMAVGIRPNIELAKSAGLHCERGVVVNDIMQTFDPRIYAVGECVQHRGIAYGLVEPLWGQAFVCATQLAERGSIQYRGTQLATQLKVSGVEVFSAGNLTSDESCEDLVIRDTKRGIYKRLILKNNQVQGAVLYGDARDGTWYSELISEQTDISSIRNRLLFGRDFALKQAS